MKNLPANAGDAGWISASVRSPGEGNNNTLQYSCLGNPLDRGVWQAVVYGVAKESDTTEWLNNNYKSCRTLLRPHGLQPHQAPLSVVFPRLKYWNALLFPSPGDLPDPGIEPVSLALAGGFFTIEPPGNPIIVLQNRNYYFPYFTHETGAGVHSTPLPGPQDTETPEWGFELWSLWLPGAQGDSHASQVLAWDTLVGLWPSPGQQGDLEDSYLTVLCLKFLTGKMDLKQDP